MEIQRQLILNSQPEHMKVLINGAINIMLMHYDSAIKSALYDLYESVPKQTNDADWWDDDLRKAMDNAKILIDTQ